MTMELQLSTASAQKALEAFQAKIAATEAKLNAFDTSGVDKVNKDLGRLTGPGPEVTKNVRDFASALRSLDKNQGFKSVASGLRAIGNLGNLSSAAGHVQALASALRLVRAPRGMEKLATNIGMIGIAAQSATPKVIALAGALGNVHAPVGLNTAINQMLRAGQAGTTAAGGVKRFGSELRLLGGIGVGVGVWQTYNVLKQITGASMDAADQFIAFNAKMQAVGHGAADVANALDYVRDVTHRLALPLSTGLESFSKMRVSMAEVGHTSQETKQVFEGFSTAFRAMGLSAEKSNRAFNAVTQMFTKGQVMAEELKQQLGEVFPAAGSLAKSMGVEVSELFAAMENGRVKTSAVALKWANDLKAQFAPAAEYLSTTGTAAVTRFTSALFELSAFSGEGIYRGLRDGLTSLSAAMNTNEVRVFAATIGATLGAALGAAAYLVGLLAQSIGSAIQILSSLGSTVTSVIGGIVGWIDSIVPVFTFMGTAAESFGFSMAGLVPHVLGATIALGVLVGGAKLLIAAWALLTPLFTATVVSVGLLIGKFVLAGAAVVAFAAAANAAWDSFWNGTSFVDEFNQNIGLMGQLLVEAGSSFSGFVSGAVNAEKAMLNAEAATDEQNKSLALIRELTEESNVGLSKFADTAGKAGDATTKAATGTRALASELPLLNSSALGVTGSFEGLAASSDSMSSSMFGAGNSASDLGMGLSEMGSSANGAVGGLNASASAANSAAGSYLNAAAAARTLSSSITSLQVTGGRSAGRQSRGAMDDADSQYTTDFDFSSSASDSFDFGSSKKGGYATAPRDTMRASASAFKNAPHLAGGIANTNVLTPSLPGGGIPTVLHPNEAVVPLAGGGAIPVAMGGGNGAGPQGAEMVSGIWKIYNTNQDILIAVGRVYEILDATLPEMGVRIKSIEAILKGMKTVFDSIESKFNTFSSGGGGSSIGSSSSSSSGVGSLSGGAGSDEIQSLLSQYRGLVSRREDAQASLNNSEVELQGFRWGGGPVQYTDKNRAQVEQRKRDLARASREIGDFIRANPELQAFLNSGSSQGGGGSSGSPTRFSAGFATGSPNASRDMRGGGFRAVLHPDEAVIPLPDGRSVPVKLPREMTQAMSRQRDNSDSGTPRQVNNITMNIQTPDAGSFRASKDQIVNELRAALARGGEKSGPPVPKVDDPTRRMAKVT